MKKTLDWLVKQVNILLDRDCGCSGEDCEESPLISPNIKFNWGQASATQIKTDYYRNVTVDNGNITAEINVYNLEVEINNFEDIQDYNPILLIDRYKHRSKKDSGGDYRKAGYKHESVLGAIGDGRINEIALSSSKEIINFGQENYFFLNPATDEFQGRGMGKRYNSPGNQNTVPNTGVETFVHLGFRLRLTIGDKTIETNHLGYLRMELSRVFSPILDKTVHLTYRYA